MAEKQLALIFLSIQGRDCMKSMFIIGTLFLTTSLAQGAEPPKTSYSPVVPKEPFTETLSRMKAEKPAVMQRQMDLLQRRYDLRNEPAPGVRMAAGKAVQQGVRVKLKTG